jgi:hypothetical protein
MPDFRGLEEMDWANADYVTIRIKTDNELIRKSVKATVMALHDEYPDEFVAYITRKVQ